MRYQFSFIEKKSVVDVQPVLPFVLSLQFPCTRMKKVLIIQSLMRANASDATNVSGSVQLRM